MGRYGLESYSRLESLEPGSELGKAVDDYLQTHLAQISADRKSSRLETWDGWKEFKWHVNDAEVNAVGVAHVPETLLDYREQLEHAIADADVVVTEFAPEAAGFYEPVTELHNQDDVKQVVLQNKLDQYVINERKQNIGIFHHDIELLAAKYNKPLLCADMDYSRTPEEYFTGEDNEQIAPHSSSAVGLLKGVEAVTAAVPILPKKVNRRNFLKVAAPAAVGLAAAAYAHHEKHKDDSPVTVEAFAVRDIVLAISLRQLSRKYKKVCVIYGSGHLPVVEYYLKHPDKLAEAYARNKERIDYHNPDPYRLYKLTPGHNKSTRAFVPSNNKVWQRQPDSLELTKSTPYK